MNIRISEEPTDERLALKPFHVDDDTFYTAGSARPLSTFGYAYPEIEDWKYNKDDLAAQVRQKANDLYNNQKDEGKKHKKHKRTTHPHHAGVSQPHKRAGDDVLALDDILGSVGKFLEAVGHIGATTLEKFAELGINNLKKQWVVNVKVDG